MRPLTRRDFGRLALAAPFVAAQAPRRRDTPPLLPPVVEGRWLRPAPGDGASEPIWGHAEGLQVGLWPTPGPRGLLRLYTPYLGQPRLRVVNFIAVEPVAGGTRGLSELERSRRDGRPGLVFESSDALEGPPLAGDHPARGVVGKSEDGAETLAVFVRVEPFANGARPIVQLEFRADRPREVTLRTFDAPGSAPMVSCVLTATMGNYMRVRRVWLRDGVAWADRLYADFRPDRLGFAPHTTWPLDRLLVVDGQAVVAATTDELDPAAAAYDPKVVRGWHYQGRPGTQYWKAPARPGLVARVNARRTYWASEAPIPHGVSFENFELEAPYQRGERWTFGVTPEPPETLGFPRDLPGSEPVP